MKSFLLRKSTATCDTAPAPCLLTWQPMVFVKCVPHQSSDVTQTVMFAAAPLTLFHWDFSPSSLLRHWEIAALVLTSQHGTWQLHYRPFWVPAPLRRVEIWFVSRSKRKKRWKSMGGLKLLRTTVYLYSVDLSVHVFTLPELIVPSRTVEDECCNIQAIIDSFSLDVLHMSLSHISGEEIIRGNVQACYDLMDVFHSYYDYVLRPNSGKIPMTKFSKSIFFW